MSPEEYASRDAVDLAALVAIGETTDGGGSTRIPAACCGLVGLKPNRARNTLAPGLGDIMNGLVREHVVTRTVRDLGHVVEKAHLPLGAQLEAAMPWADRRPRLAPQ